MIQISDMIAFVLYDQSCYTYPTDTFVFHNDAVIAMSLGKDYSSPLGDMSDGNVKLSILSNM
jgi:hypothetical protein